MTKGELIFAIQDFVGSVADSWSDPGEEDQSIKSYQDRYLHSMLRGATTHCRAYWILDAANLELEKRVLIRSLLERHVNSHLASTNPDFGIVLMAADVSSSLSALQKARKLFRGEDLIAHDRYVQEHQAELEVLHQSHPDPRSKKTWNQLERFDHADLETAYRTVYSHLCQFSHASSQGPGIEDTNEPFLDRLSLEIPLLIAHSFYLVLASRSTRNQEVENRFESLRKSVIAYFDDSANRHDVHRD